MTGRRDTQPDNASTLGTIVFLALGPLVWAAHFTLIYGGHTLACTGQTGARTAVLVVVVATAAAAVAVLLFLIWPAWIANALGVRVRRGDRPTYLDIARILGILAEIAIVWGGITAALVGPCTLGR